LADESAYGRETVQIVEIEQPRCVNRFGVAPCTATGTPKCYNVYWTCLDTPNYNGTGSIKWRFSRPQDQLRWVYEETDANNIATNCIPMVRSVSATSSRINIGANRKGESPLGTRASVRIQMQDIPWDDHVGDFYLADRTAPAKRPGFWALWTVRNPFYPNIKIRVYEGYKGQALSAMQVRLYDLENVSGPDANGRVTITGRDPLDKARRRKAKFPAVSQIDLAADIDASTQVIPVTCLEAQLTAAYGNTGATKFIAIDDEIIEYTGYSGTEPDLTLTGVRRARLGTAPAEHSENDAVQRVGRYVNIRPYEVAEDLLKNHTEVDNSYVNTGGQWDDEGQSYLSTIKVSATIPESEAVEDLLGELCRDGLFSIWWDERLQRIPLLAVRPPGQTPVVWTDAENVLQKTYSKTVKPDDRLTRVSIFFKPRDPFAAQDDVKNYENRRVRIDGEVELAEAAGGEIVENVIYSRWLQTFGNALLVGASQLLRYRLPPEYATVTVDAKDRDASIGDVIDLETRHQLDTEGNRVSKRWQVIDATETKAGEKLQVEMQSYLYVGKFAIIMENTAPIYSLATAEERLNGCWIAENTGLMPDGTEPYLLQ